MESNVGIRNISRELPEKAVMDSKFEKSTANKSLVINNDSTVAPVIIEELDENAINSMDVDISEFVEAKALQIREVENIIIPNYIPSTSCNSNKDASDMEEQDTTSLTVDEEDQLTKQFLNGELTFTEYSSRMDQDVDLETMESDISRYDLFSLNT